MKDTFDFQDILFELFKNDSELRGLLGIDTDDFSILNSKLRREDFAPEKFEEETLDFVAFYFADADTTGNYLVNQGLLRLDIYAEFRYNAGLIRRRLIEIIRESFDIRVIAEGQKESGLTNVYKYRLELLPLVTS